MAMALAACNTITRQRLAEVNHDGVKYFMEKIMFQVYENFDDQDFVDVTFKLSNPSALITAHRLILAAASPYFRKLFKSDEGICPILQITNIDSDTFERLVTHCYTGKTLITIDNVDKMLKASLLLQLDDAVANCVDFLMEHITDYTLQRAYGLESETQCGMLSQKIVEYETCNFMSIIGSNEFLNFDAEKLQAIIESDQLNIRCEKDAFDVVKQWYEHDASARKQKLPDLIACLRLTQFDTSFLMGNIYPLPGCDKLALKVIAWTSQPSTRSQLTLKYTEKREGQIMTSEEKSLMAFNLETGTIFQYNKTDDLWQKWVDIKLDVSNYGIIFMNECIILTGGERGGEDTNEVRSWSLKTKKIQQLLAMNEARSCHSIVMLNENIYVMGGWVEYEESRSVEMYSVSHGWKPVSSMIKPRRNPGAVAFNNKIYVMGGCDNDDLKSVECYDPITNSWTQCADMSQVHYHPGATAHNGSIFIFGSPWPSRSGTVERYDPQRDKWTKICSLSMFDRGIAAISYDNQLWAVGSGESNSVSVYDEQNDKWIEKTEIPADGRYYCFAVPKDLLKSE